MLKWILTILIALVILGLFAPHLKRWIDFGRLPGDVRFCFRGREYRFPFTSTLILSALLAAIAHTF